MSLVYDMVYQTIYIYVILKYMYLYPKSVPRITNNEHCNFIISTKTNTPYRALS